MNTSIITQSPVSYTEMQYQRTEAATYARIVQAQERRQERMAKAQAATAAFTGIDDGNVIFLA